MFKRTRPITDSWGNPIEKLHSLGGNYWKLLYDRGISTNYATILWRFHLGCDSIVQYLNLTCNSVRSQCENHMWFLQRALATFSKQEKERACFVQGSGLLSKELVSAPACAIGFSCHVWQLCIIMQTHKEDELRRHMEHLFCSSLLF